MKQQKIIKKRTSYRWLIIFFCLIAAVRVFIYLAAFPFFNNVDEYCHFDLVMKYSHGHIPRSIEKVSTEAAECIVTYGSPEYLKKPGDYPEQQFPPPVWKLPKESTQDYIDHATVAMSTVFNYESSQPPLYYLIAGLWTKIGSSVGIKGIWLLYWIRCFNILLVTVLVWIAYLAALNLFPENRFVVLGVPLLVALLPQDTYYSISNDALSPVCFGLAFLSMVWFIRSNILSTRYAILTGLAAGATVLVKTSNLPLLVVFIAILLFKIYKLSGKRTQISITLQTGLFLLSMLLPVFIWFGWNLSNYGDLTASETKIRTLGWTHKSFLEWFSHPIFSLKGVSVFWSALMTSFWRGEFVWTTASMSMPAADVFYWLSSFIFVLLAVIAIRRSASDLEKWMSWFAFWSFASILIFLVLLSISFDFGNCPYPSNSYPYLSSGRLISAALIPFLLLYVNGLNRTFSWIKSESFRLGILIGIGVFITVSEIIVNRPAFSSQFNFFHL